MADGTLSREDAERVLAEWDRFAAGSTVPMAEHRLADALRAMLELHDSERRLVKQAEQQHQRLIAQRDAAERRAEEAELAVDMLAVGDPYERLRATIDAGKTALLERDEARRGRDAAEERGVRLGLEAAAELCERVRCRTWEAHECARQIRSHRDVQPAAIIAAAREREPVREEPAHRVGDVWEHDEFGRHTVKGVSGCDGIGPIAVEFNEAPGGRLVAMMLALGWRRVRCAAAQQAEAREEGE